LDELQHTKQVKYRKTRRCYIRASYLGICIVWRATRSEWA